MTDRAWWEEQGYLYGRCLDPEADLWVCVAPMIYSARLMLCTPAPFGGVLEYYCYPWEVSEVALGAARVWDGRSAPPAGWVKASGGRRPGG